MSSNVEIFVAPFSNPTAGQWTDAIDAVETFESFGDIEVAVMDSDANDIINEFTQPDVIVEIAELSTDELAQYRVAVAAELSGDSVAEMVEDAQERIRAHAFHAGDLNASVQDAYEEMAGLEPGSLAATYFDWEAFARDIILSNIEVKTVDGVFLVSSC